MTSFDIHLAISVAVLQAITGLASQATVDALEARVAALETTVASQQVTLATLGEAAAASAQHRANWTAVWPDQASLYSWLNSTAGPILKFSFNGETETLCRRLHITAGNTLHWHAQLTDTHTLQIDNLL